MSARRRKIGASVALVVALAAISDNGAAQSTPPAELARFFRAPPEYRGVHGEYRSPLIDKDGNRAATPDDWLRRREALRDEWHEILGRWPALIAEPRSEFLSTEKSKA